MRATVRSVLLALALGAAVLLAGVAVVVSGGLYEVSATRPHTQWVYSLLEATKRQSVRRHARSIDEPPPSSPSQLQDGAVCFRDHCAACHGAPGEAPAAAALAMQPLPGPLQDAGRQWRARELAWILRHGVRMSGMPAWSGLLDDADIWAVVAYLRWLPEASPSAHRALLVTLAPRACPLRGQDAGDRGVDAGPVSPERGRAALRRHGCQGCHQIPGVVGGPSDVGPPLAGMARRQWIAGVLPNSPENLAAWVRDPQRYKPGTAMPGLGVGAADAQAMAAYLGRLH